jgi:hypothetical protein
MVHSWRVPHVKLWRETYKPATRTEKAMKKSNRNLSPCLFVLDGGGHSISRHCDLAGGHGRIYPVRACYLPHVPVLTAGGLGVV